MVAHIRTCWANDDFSIPPETPKSEVPEDNNIQIQFYPNPVDDVLYIKAINFETAFMRIININGKIIKDRITPQTNFEIDTSLLPEGIYFIQLTNEDFLMHQRKVVVVR